MAVEQPIIEPITVTYDRIEGSDFIFKKGNYDIVYIQVTITGTPTNVTFNLVDENLNQLYSPYDIAGNSITSTCSITANGYPNIIQLPANFNSDLSEWTDFDAGIYNWNLYWGGDSTYNAITLPLTVEIRDFDRVQVLTPEIYPYDNILVKFRTWLDTPVDITNTNSLSNYTIMYNANNEICTISPDSPRVNTVGTHYLDDNTYRVDYIIKNPFKITFSDNISREYSTANTSITIESDEQQKTYIATSPIIYINGQGYSNYSPIQTEYGIGTTIAGSQFPPGTYNIEATSEYRPNHLCYTATATMVVTTENCSITLQEEETTSSLIATYLHNETPIPNATVYVREFNNDTIIYTNQTDINGQIQLDLSAGRYQAIVQDNYTSEDLLYSNIINIENPCLNNITISNSDLITTYGLDTPINEISINNYGDLILTLDDEVNNIISDVYIGENGELYYRSE